MPYRKRILYSRGVVPMLAKRFSVTEVTVRSALRFATEGEQPDRIREIALKEYGCKISKVPIVETNRK